MRSFGKSRTAFFAIGLPLVIGNGALAQEVPVNPCDDPNIVCAPPIGPANPNIPSLPSVNASGSRFVSLSGLQEARVNPDERDEIPIEAAQAAGMAEADGFTGPVWVSLNGRISELGDSELELTALSAGTDLWFNETTILGAMAQVDRSVQTNPTAEDFDTLGYMIGPYAIYQLDDLTIDARILAGQARTDIEDGTDSAEDVDSERYLASFQATSPIVFNNGFTIVPRVGAAWIQDELDGYDLGTDTVAPESVSYGQADVGANFVFPASFGATEGSFVLGTSGIFVFGDDAGDQVQEELRARVDIGTELYGNDSWSFSARVFADGLGQSQFSSTGVDLGVLIWF